MKEADQKKSARYVHPRPRLACAASLTNGADVFADIGCDHGRLGISLLQSRAIRHAILSEISVQSLEKARILAKTTGLEDRIEFRVGDGLSVLCDGEAQALSICGMGGMLIAEILEAARKPLAGARLAVLQPMRTVEVLREYLFRHNYRIVEDVIACDSSRLYQIFSVEPGKDCMPEYWPEDFFDLGFRAMRDPLFPALANRLLRQTEQSLTSARGTRGEAALVKRAKNIERVLAIMA